MVGESIGCPSRSCPCSGVTIDLYAILAGAVIAAMAVSSAAHSGELAKPTAVPQRLQFSVCGFIQSDFDEHGHGRFEAVVQEGRYLVHYSQLPGKPEPPRSWPRRQLITDQAEGPGCIIQSDFENNHHGRFEVIVPERQDNAEPGVYALVHYSLDRTEHNASWQRRRTITHEATGSGSIIQSSIQRNGHGRFEVVVPLKGGELVHFVQNHDPLDPDWDQRETITAGVAGSASIIESDYTAPTGERDFELVALIGDPEDDKPEKLVHFRKRNVDPESPWIQTREVTSQATGPGSLIQSDIRSPTGHGHFVVVVPEGDSLVHYFRANVDPEGPWLAAASFVIGAPDATGPGTIVQSDFQWDNHGYYEVLVTRRSSVCHSDYPCVIHHYWVPDDTPEWEPGLVVAVTGRSQKICQLTGGVDKQWGYETLNRTTDVYVTGTDLGIPIVHRHASPDRGPLYFFFGDSPPPNLEDDPEDRSSPYPECIGKGCDSYASTGDIEPEDCVGLSFVTDGVAFRRLDITGVPALEQFEVPSGGYSTGDDLFLFAAVDCRQRTRIDADHDGNLQEHPWTRYDRCGKEDAVPPLEVNRSTERAATRGVLARSRDDAGTFQRAFDVSVQDHPWGNNDEECRTQENNWAAKFIRSFAVIVHRSELPDLPYETGVDNGVLLWGTGKHRNSDVYLAFMPLGTNGQPIPRANNADRVKLRYFSGVENEKSIWTAREGDAIALFDSCEPRSVGERCFPRVGEVSVARDQLFGGWIMLYDQSGSCAEGNEGVFARVAAAPWGDWSPPEKVFGKFTDGGLCHFIDGKDACGHEKKGGAYGPFIIGPYTKYDLGSQETILYYLMSTWSPYQVLLMRTILKR